MLPNGRPPALLWKDGYKASGSVIGRYRSHGNSVSPDGYGTVPTIRWKYLLKEKVPHSMIFSMRCSTATLVRIFQTLPLRLRSIGGWNLSTSSFENIWHIYFVTTHKLILNVSKIRLRLICARALYLYHLFSKALDMQERHGCHCSGMYILIHSRTASLLLQTSLLHRTTDILSEKRCFGSCRNSPLKVYTDVHF